MSRGPCTSSDLEEADPAIGRQIMKLVAPCPPAQIDEGGAAAIEHADRPFAETAPSCLIQGPGAVKKIAVPHRYRALCLFEITNFVILRRHLGREEAERLIPSFIRVIADQSPDIRLTATGRATAELSFECDDPEHASRTVDLLRSCLPLMGVGGGSYPVSTRFGLAVAPGRNCDELRLIEAAEAALDEARSQEPIVVRDLSCAELAFDRLAMMRDLPRAIARGEMFIHYQPKVHVRRQKVASAEALLRWHHPTHGLIAPGDFIGVAEEAGEIGALTLWTMRRVIEDQKRLAAEGHDIPLFLNISGMLLADAAFVAEACEIVSGSDAKLGFEITETAVIRDPESAIRHLQNFARIGVQLAIDDYGAGLSSLAYLKQLPARELKIDKMFVLQLTSSNRDPLIVRSTIDLAHALEMEVTAEGVETPSALALLSVMGCDMVQGFLISRPVALDALLTFLHEDAHLTSGVGGQSPFARPESFWKRA